VSERDRYRCSFDAVAETYERGRPGYAPQAVEWIAERLPFVDVLDLAAGTGKLTRQLVALGAHVIAVEPGDGMRAVLARVVPEATALAGSAEAIPLPDSSVDAITVGQAFHWFRHEEALAEMHRVLRPGGGIALLWNIWNDDDPIQRGLDQLVEGVPARVRREGPSPSERLAASSLFGPVEERTFTHPFPTTPDAVVEWVASTSPVATAAPDERARIEAEVRALLPAFPFELALDTTVLLAPRVS
jgi:SAM-dependent methyltransferase